jgi:hypothetical protein
LAIALLFVGVLGVYRMGLREGYAQGWLQAGAQEEAAPSPDGAPYLWGPRTQWGAQAYGHRIMRGGHLGRFMVLGLGVLLLLALVKAVLFKAFLCKAWHVHGACGKAGSWRKPPHAPWGHGPWDRAHGPWGRWGCHEDGDGEDKASEAPKDEQYGKAPSEPDAA